MRNVLKHPDGHALQSPARPSSLMRCAVEACLADRLWVLDLIPTQPRSVYSSLTSVRLPAVAVVRGDSKVSGTVTLVQESESAPTTISWDITGNDANAKRGFHIHTFGDNTNGCTSAGPHCELPRIQEPGTARALPIVRLYLD